VKQRHGPHPFGYLGGLHFMAFGVISHGGKSTQTAAFASVSQDIFRLA
jgi:hypothetical protein